MLLLLADLSAFRKYRLSWLQLHACLSKQKAVSKIFYTSAFKTWCHVDSKQEAKHTVQSTVLGTCLQMLSHDMFLQEWKSHNKNLVNDYYH